MHTTIALADELIRALAKDRSVSDKLHIIGTVQGLLNRYAPEAVAEWGKDAWPPKKVVGRKHSH